MRDIVKEYQEKFRRNHQRARRYTALLLALALTTSLFVNWQLHGVGIAKTAEYLCGEVEHEHTDACYEKQLVCGYEEGEPEDWNATMTDDGTSFDDTFGMDDDAFGVDADDPGIAAYSAEPEYIFVPHEHTDDCYQEVQELTCREEEHEHTDDCFDPEDGSLICDLFEHTHDDSCYTTTYELVCGLEEGELVEEVNPDYDPVALFEEPVAAKPVVVDPVIETPVHHHTDACYEEVLVCGLPEHHHTVNCLADPLDGTQDEDEWLSQTGTSLTGLWMDDLLAVAESQLGYEQSEKNFELDDADGTTVHYYTRYGAWYGNSYGPWDVTFLSYCLNYAGIPQSAIPQVSSVLSLHSQLRSALYNEETGSGYAMDFDGDLPSDAAMPGDIVIYNGTVTKAVAVESEPLQVQDDSADADIALLSMDAAATTGTAPHIEEYTVDASTVGIVSDVDEDSGTLTVISGDVDGKVAKVTLNASQVTTLVSVANAQQADYGVATLDYKVEDGNTTVTGLDITSQIDNAHIEKKDGDYWVTSDHFTTEDQVRASFEFSGISASELLNNNCKAYIPLPDGIDCSKILEGGKIEDTSYTAGGGYSGTYHFELVDGHYVVVLEYDKAYIDERVKDNLTVSGDVNFEFSWDKNKINTDGENKITMGGHELTITIEKKDTPVKDEDHFSVTKHSSSLTMDGTTAVIKYRISVKIKNEMKGPLVLEDVLTAPAGFSYSGTPSFKKDYGISSISWADNATTGGKTITLGDEDTVFKTGTYEIVYEVRKENFGDENYTQDAAVTNKVTMTKDGETHEDDTKTSITTKLIEKTGKASTGENGKTYITWTVKLNYGSSKRNLKNATFTDTIPNDQKFVADSFTVKENDETVASPNVTIEGNRITYPLTNGFNSYEITYQTEVTSDIPLDGTTITNTGKIDGDGLSGEDTGKADVKKSVLNKSAVDSPTISGSTATLHWTSHIDVTDLNGYVYTDYSGGYWTQEKGNFCPQQIDLESIRVTDGSGADVTPQLNTAGKIKGYQHMQGGVDLGLFQIDFSGTSITGPVDIAYNTTVDLSVLPQNPGLTNYGTLTKDGHSQSDSANQTITTVENNWKSLLKYAGNGWTTDNSGSTELEIGEKLPWTVWLNVEGVITESRGDWVVEDTLPAGMLLDKTSIALDFNGSSPVLGTDYTIDTYTNAEGRTVLRIVLKESAYTLSDGSVQKRIKLTYDTTLDPDSGFCKGDQKEADFTNDVSFTHDGKKENDSFTETITRNTIGKHGSYDPSTGLLTYTIEVNPDGATLANGNELKLEDSMKIPEALREKDGHAGFVSLEGITVFRGERQSDGSLIAGACLRTLSKAANKNAADLFSYYTDFDSDNSHLRFNTKVEDRTPLVLVVQYSVKDKVDGLSPDGTFTFKNTVKLAGKWEQKDVAQDATFSSGAHSSLDYNHDRVTVVKYSNNQSNPLAGATFELDRYDSNTKRWSKDQLLSTGSMGTLVFGSLNRNVLYCLWETEAPYGYVPDYTPTYFYITPSLTDNPLPNASGSDGTLLDSNNVIVYTVQDGVFQNFFFYRNNVRDETIVQKGELLVNKNWQNHDGSAVEDPSTMPEVIVTLTKHSPSYVTVTFTGNTSASDSIKVPKGSSLTTQASQTAVTVQGTVDFSEGTNSSWQHVYYFKNIQSDLTVSMPGFSMNGWILAATTVDTSTASSDTESTMIGTVQLDKTNHWSYRWKDLETGEGITYSVTEQPVTGYTTTYQLNSNNIEAGTHFSLSESGDKVTITNTAEESGGYVLPSTGGAGTKLYTAGGGALMLAALVCWVCRKRRRERRAR